MNPTTEIDIAGQVSLACGAAVDRKAVNVRALFLAAVTDFTDYFVICSGGTERQVRAIAESVDKRLREEAGLRALHTEGLSHGRWVLMDYGDFVVHIFVDEMRDFYGLERLWSDAPDHTAQLGQ